MCMDYVLISCTVKKTLIAGMHYHLCVSPSVNAFAVRKFEPRLIFDQIMHHSAGNYQFAIHTFLLTSDTD